MASSPIFTVEANIGAGKSTLLSELPDALPDGRKIVKLLEPVNDWMSFKAASEEKGLFELYYNDKKRYGFVFQMLALQSRIQDIVTTVRNNPGSVIVCERCYLTDNELFAKMLYEDGFMSETEYMVYKRWFDFVQETLDFIRMTGVIYIRADPQVCVSRIIKRNREGEEAINLSYIKKLHEHHERWIATLHKDDKGSKLLEVDGNDKPDMTAIIEFIQANA